ncbi:hypothetical protein B0J12DRAFT_27001 [Macrophomina phaseolina]|uniref:Uncharacterized protein n=1 Tax=Macrophomina phaseolina TaxID=35725 RepID=A0ABQ8GV97_9PEZI|nr:hypothetical protein B0J12DRAFT_27001 [Macrophomina phaseolina]
MVVVGTPRGWVEAKAGPSKGDRAGDALEKGNKRAGRGQIQRIIDFFFSASHVAADGAICWLASGERNGLRPPWSLPQRRARCPGCLSARVVRRRRPSCRRPHYHHSRSREGADNLRPGSWVQRATQGRAGHRAGPGDQGRARCASIRPHRLGDGLPRQAGRRRLCLDARQSCPARVVPEAACCKLERRRPRTAAPEARGRFQGSSRAGGGRIARVGLWPRARFRFHLEPAQGPAEVLVVGVRDAGAGAGA